MTCEFRPSVIRKESGLVSGNHVDRIAQWHDSWKSREGDERRLRVRWLLNPHQPPIENAEISERRGQVTGVRVLSDAEQSQILPVILVPPLVNAHTHLEFSAIEQPLRPASPFPDWIRSVMQWRRTAADTAVTAVKQGIAESFAAGVRVLGEISTSHDPQIFQAFETFCQRSRQIVSFREIIGLNPERIPELVARAELHLQCANGASWIAGISPHAPYTVHPKLLESLTELASRRNVPVAMHIAETLAERELLEQGRGALADFLQSLDLFETRTFPGGRSVLELLEQLARAPRSLVVHGNYLTEGEIQFISSCPGMTVVYCPRTHAFFGHSAYPLETMLKAGCRVAIGTDSRASNPDLSLWREFQFILSRYPQIPLERLLKLVTESAAAGLGVVMPGMRIEPGSAFAPVFIRCGIEHPDLRTVLQHPESQPVTPGIADR